MIPFKIYPEIFSGQGSYAEYHVAHEAIVAHKPANLSHIEAASIPLAGGTAWDALITRARVQPGETVLIHGAGGVGSLAIQIAAAAGARVLVTAGAAMTALAGDLGAARVMDYKQQNFIEEVNQLTNGRGVDVVFDTVGGDLLARSIAVVRPHGRMVGIVSTSGDLNGALIKNIRLDFLFLERARYKLDALRALLEREQIKPVINSILPLTEVAEAHRRIEQGGLKGKIVLNTTA